MVYVQYRLASINPFGNLSPPLNRALDLAKDDEDDGDGEEDNDEEGVSDKEIALRRANLYVVSRFDLWPY